MKTSIAHLPEHKQNDLQYIVGLIKKYMPEAGMVILYGSYAKGTYTSYDVRDEFGIATAFQSDFDILVLTCGIPQHEALRKRGQITNSYLDSKFPHRQTPIDIIQDDIALFNEKIEKGQYFYTQIKEEGIILYDKGIFKLAERKELNYLEISQQAKEYYDYKFRLIDNQIRMSNLGLDNDLLNDSIFHLHQAFENLYHCVLLVFSLDSDKDHKLESLNKKIKKFASDVSKAFHPKDPKTKELFDKIEESYVGSRYNKDFAVSPEQITQLREIFEKVRIEAVKACQHQFKKYDKLYKESSK